MILLIKLNTADSIDLAIKENLMTVIYFTGNACGACEVIKEKIEKLLESYPKVKSYEINGEEHPEVASKYLVFSLPLFILFVDNKETIRTGRYVDLLSLEKNIDRYYNMTF